ncbi:protein LOW PHOTOSYNTHETIC EFFICIENCY 1, chloroplastic [Prosopis cineraria]|uniref:protein LOW PHOTOSYNTHETIC EFFICIENCY 1, chloroplastic n=1 Tax=Prosopis cineraria TaxID=364024 RepID=UPI00241040EA|nr:protein LOW PHOTOSYNTHETIC EFFICIENCY 1, chloroplastic [Prosopis cineraria]
MNDSSLGSERDGINCLNLDEVQDSNYEQQMQGGENDSKLMLGHLQSAKTVDEMEEIHKDKGELPPQVYSTIMRGFGKEKKMDSASILMNLLKRKRTETNGSFSPNLFIYNSLLGTVKQSQQFAEVETIMNEMDQTGITPKVGVEPNAYAYTIMASIHTALGNFNRVDDIISEMVTLGIELTVVTFNAIVSGCARGGMSSAAYE